MAVRIESGSEPIPGYRLIERLGGGGFGEVWRAEAPGGLQKAIKFVFGDLSNVGDNSQRAEQELKALKRVQTVRHPYILSLERYDVIEGRLIIVMELADRNLWDRFKECRAQGLPGIPREELLGYMEETAEALDLMNEVYQLQHLDIKPQNIFLIHQHVKVADFGLVKDLEGSQASVTGGVTPVYAAPETFDGRVTRFSDQYSLAILYQELLTGQRPFLANNVRQLILQHLQATPNIGSLPTADQPIITRALKKIPEERYPSCRELVKALRRANSPEIGREFVVRGDSFPSLPTAPADVGRTDLRTPSSPVLRPDSAGSGILTPALEPSDGPPTASLRGLFEGGSAQGVTQFIRGGDASVLREPEPTQHRAPTEISGPGSLFPTLVIGLGQIGLTVLQHTREQLSANVGMPGQIPSLRLLLCDTDPEVVRLATRGAPGCALSASEVFLMPLNRPSYYVKPRDGRPALDSWLNSRMLYRIPRSQVTTGVRALGRLAFFDNYRSIVRRLQMELETILDPNHLQTAARETGLGVRSNRPRVYIVTSLAGGTGSGVFLDLAYTLRALLRQAGYEQPDVVGVLLLPAVDASRTRVMTLGNTFAALTELNHFANPANMFKARYHDRESPIQDSGPPFSRCVILPLPEETDEIATQEMVELSGQFLARDTTSPLGRAADLGRANVPPPPWDSRGLFYQTFGLHHVSTPRREMIETISRRLCQWLVQRWMTKDAKPFRMVVHQWVREQWQSLEMGAETFIERLQEGMVGVLGRPAEMLFDGIIGPAVEASLGPGARGGSRSGELRPIPPEKLAELLQAFRDLLGTPEEAGTNEAPGSLMATIREVGEQLTNEWGQKLAELPIHLIEDPEFRLAGAEESIRELVATLEQSLQHQEPLNRELSGKANEAYARLQQLANPLPGVKRPPVPPQAVADLLKNYPRWRYRSLILNQVAGAFLSLRGHLSDELREVNFCRVRLGELLRMLEDPPDHTRPGGRSSGVSRKFFAGGCRDLNEAVEGFLSEITVEHLQELDGRVQEMIKARFTALVHVCLTPDKILKDVEMELRATAREFTDSYLPPVSAAELFFEQHPDDASAESEIAALYDEAAPELTADNRSPRPGPPVGEICVLGVPEGEASERFQQAVQRVFPELELTTTPSIDDLLIYRERLNLSLADLPQLGSLGRDAYKQMTATDHFTPHSRIDVEFRPES
jgi:eukaryotic-like serine/threonine-protein kinase